MAARPTAQEALKAALRTTVAPILREAGYKGSAPTWSRASARGDRAIVNVQSSKFSTAEKLRCIVNLAVAPEPWLSYQAYDFDKPVPKAVKEYHGLWRMRLDASSDGREKWWVVSDERTAAAAAADMLERLREEGLPRLDALLDRAALVEELRQGRLGDLDPGAYRDFIERALLVLLADEGPSDELERIAHRIRHEAEARNPEHDRRRLEWVERRVAMRAQERTGRA